MRHLDPDDAALAALGEPLGPGEQQHLEQCPTCAREVRALADAARTARGSAGEAVVPAPAAVWERISAELDLAPDVRPGGGADGGAPAPSRRAGQGAVPRRRWWLVAVAALVVGALGGGAVVAAWLRPAPETVLAQARLDALPGWSASGDAVLEEDADGRLTLVVQVSSTSEDGFRAVWLLDRDATRLVSLGALDGDEGRFAVPVGLDLDEFPVVDVSAEPFDGDPGHSGDSIVRGALDLGA